MGPTPRRQGRHVAGGRPWPRRGGTPRTTAPICCSWWWILTAAADGAVPIAHRLESGNTEDSTTHIATWDSLCALLGRNDFLYVADCKLATRENMEHIDKGGGRFVSVLPATRKEDGHSGATWWTMRSSGPRPCAAPPDTSANPTTSFPPPRRPGPRPRGSGSSGCVRRTRSSVTPTPRSQRVGAGVAALDDLNQKLFVEPVTAEVA